MSVLYSPTIRSLHQNGLNFLLFENEERRDELVSAQVEENPVKKPYAGQTTQNTSNRLASPENRTHLSATTANSAGKYLPPTLATESQKRAQNNTAQNAVPHSPHLATQAKSSVSSTQQAAPQKVQSAKNETLTMEHWPSEWINLYERFGLPKTENDNSQIRVAWTYAGLERDVLGPANKQRQAIIRELTLELNHKQGTHSFIPYSFVQDDESSQLIMHQNVSFFWSAMRLVRPRVLLIFGSVARDTLNMPKITPLQKIDMGALQVLQMHKPETLAENRDHYTKSVAFLQEYLRFCPKKTKN